VSCWGEVSDVVSDRDACGSRVRGGCRDVWFVLGGRPGGADVRDKLDRLVFNVRPGVGGRISWSGSGGVVGVVSAVVGELVAFLDFVRTGGAG
jgi:hypothetical protein